jgi:hypothetical protein
MNKETYKANVKCVNCDYVGSMNIEKGKRIMSEVCPACGCKSLHKNPFAKKEDWYYKWRGPYTYPERYFEPKLPYRITCVGGWS